MNEIRKKKIINKRLSESNLLLKRSRVWWPRSAEVYRINKQAKCNVCGLGLYIFFFIYYIF